MNQRLNIAELAELLTEYTGKDKKQTELFLREFIAVISDALPDERIVKVKGLGTFKVIQVEERESVHVNTGERFLIPAHAKFTFTPDKDLKEQVNKPFASFETTELNEGVEFPTATAEKTREEDTEEAEEENRAPDDVEQVIPPVQEEPITRESQEAKAQPQEAIPVPRSADREEAVEEDDKPEIRNRMLVVPALFLILFVFAGFFYFTNVFSFPTKSVTKDSETTVETIAETTVEPVAAQPDDPVEEDETAVPEAAPQPPAEPERKEIVIEKIVPDSRLTLISLKHFGHKVFWVYIYEHNKEIVQNPNNIRIGTELIIPDASLYGIDAKNPESVAKAKVKQTEINSKF